ncbi:CHASE3 domain-containing protein [Roseateles sp. YR242]|uniref:HAMP domain-containing methyl-accepting chemotaxis protein n=1 Tax=Roseateles sp. YR242 TaxID=1855305 RepID=UPI0008ADAB32|nr:methyl-accepting chemotaxis protein [Roseateles sp. YR242]SEK62599.1 CHASE3 domain-containing protein [Roseateles sp. YR242]
MKTYGRSLGLGFAVASVALCVMGGLAVRSAFLMEQSNLEVTDEQEDVRAIAALSTALTATETAQRGFLLTGDRAYLVPEKQAATAVRQGLAWLQERPSLAAGGRQLAEVQRGVSMLFDLYDARIAQRPGASLDAVMASAKVAEGRQLMEGLRSRLSELERGQAAELDAAALAMNKTTAFVKTSAMAGTGMGLVLVLAVWIGLQRLLTRTVGTAADEVALQSRALTASSGRQALSSQHTATAAVQLSATLHEVQTAAGQIARRSTEVQQVAMASTHAALEGGLAAEQAQSTVQALRVQIDHVVDQMLRLGKSVQDAEGVLGTMESLAARTNILAINATIEAAGAGSAGERFQTVADEIRLLAKTMQADAIDIKRRLELIRNASNATVMTTEGGSKAVDESVKRFAEVANTLRTIVERVRFTETASREITSSTQQQSVAVQQMDGAMADVSRSAKEAEEIASGNLLTASSLSDTAQRLSAFVATPARWRLLAKRLDAAPVPQ